MDEDLWLAETDPLALLALLYPMRSHGSEPPQTRASRMYLLACARKQWHRLPRVCRVIVALIEVFAEAPREEDWLRREVSPIAEQLMHCDGGPGDLQTAYVDLVLAEHIAVELDQAIQQAGVPIEAVPNPPLTPAEWHGLAVLMYLPFIPNTPTYQWVPQELHSEPLLREVFGNPFRRIPFANDWRTDTVMSLARTMYESRDFGAMPILADALQDADCDNEDILNHCRDTKQVHVRGCWVVDLVLKLR